MEKQYFIFGEEVSRIYYNDGIDAVIEHIKSGNDLATYCWDENSTPSYLLEVYDGWGGYAEITEADYDKIIAATTEIFGFAR